MSSGEKKIIALITRNIHILFFLIITVMSVFIRIGGFPYISSDMYSCLIPWYDEIQSGGGLAALKHQVGNYNLLYQTIISLFTYLSIDTMTIYKVFSVIFDYLLAFVCADFAVELNKDKNQAVLFNMVYAVILFLPTVVLNGAFWGQCDAIYTFFIVMTCLFLYRKKMIGAFVFLGLAFAFKLQAIFIVPFLIILYFTEKSFSILDSVISLIVFWASGIAAYLFGRNPFDVFRIYMEQSDTYPYMTMNTCNMWGLFGQDYGNMKTYAMLCTAAVFGAALYLILSGKKRIRCGEEFLALAAWCVWTTVMFLPAMHERYTFLADILLVLLCFMNKRYIIPAAAEAAVSTLTYTYFLYGVSYNIVFCSLINLAAWGLFTYMIFTGMKKTDEFENESPIPDNADTSEYSEYNETDKEFNS